MSLWDAKKQTNQQTKPIKQQQQQKKQDANKSPHGDKMKGNMWNVNTSKKLIVGQPSSQKVTSSTSSTAGLMLDLL